MRAIVFVPAGLAYAVGWPRIGPCSLAGCEIARNSISEEANVPLDRRLATAHPFKMLASMILARVSSQAAWQIGRSANGCYVRGHVSSGHVRGTLRQHSGTPCLVPPSLSARNQVVPSRAGHVRMFFDEFDGRALDEFEQRAFAGIWSVKLDLDDGAQEWRIYLNPSGGKAVAVGGEACMSDTRHSYWEAKVNDDGEIRMKLHFGFLVLQGKGRIERNSIRCTMLSGWVLEGTDEPDCVGSFSMGLPFPDVRGAELRQLYKDHKEREDSRLSGLSRFRLNGFLGQWQLTVTIDSHPTLFKVELGEDGKFTSVGVGDNLRLAGSWGLYDSTSPDNDVSTTGGKYGPKLGTDLWLHVQRERCVGLPGMTQSFSMLGKPMLNSMESALLAKTGDAPVDAIDGLCYLPGVCDRFRYVSGRFMLQRP